MMKNNRIRNIEKRMPVLSLIASLIFLFSLTSAGQAFGETIYAGSPSVITVPIELAQESDIRSIDIELTYNPDVIGIGEVTLAGGIVENKDYTLVNKATDGTLIIVIYAQQKTVTAQGDVLFISFNVKGEPGTTTSISLTKFECNDLPAAGGFRVNETITDVIDIVINQPPVAEDIKLETDEDTAIKGTLIATDLDEDPLTYRIVENGAKGMAVIADDTSSEFVYTPAPDANGTDSFTYKVTDGFSDSNTAAVTIDISALPDPPRFTSTEITESSQDTAYVYAVTAADPDAGDTLTLTATDPPAWLTFTDNGDGTGILAGTPSSDDVGVHNVVLVVTDAQGATAAQTFEITVANINDPPAFSSEPVINAVQNEIYTYLITGADMDAGDTLTFTAQMVPEWLNLSDNGDGTALLAGIPANENIGENAVALELTDAAGESDIQTFIITVSDVSDAPAFTSEAIISATQDSLYTYPAVAADPDNPDASLILSAPILPDWLNFEDNGDGTGELAGTPANSDVGEHSVVLQVQNDKNMAGNQKFIIIVSNINDPPVFTSNPVLKAWQDTDYLYAVTAEDPDRGDPLKMNAPDLPSWLTFRDNGDGTGSLMGTPGTNDTGEHSIRLKVKDAAGEITTQTFVINVSGPNTEPAFTSTPITGAMADVAYSYTITAGDPDAGDPLMISSLGILPDWLAFSDNGDGTAILSGTPAEDDLGEYAINLQVEDPAGATDAQFFTIRVSAFAAAPIFITEPMICALQDAPYFYRVATTSPDTAGILTISGLTLPDWLLLEDNGDGTGYLKGTPGTSGDYEAVLEVKDGLGDASVQSFTIHVLETNSAPRFTSTPLTESLENTEYQYSVTAEDADSCGSLTITAPVLPEWLRLTDNGDGTAELTGTPGTNDVGIHSVKLRVKDVLGMAEVQKFTIRVLNISNPPVFTSTPIGRAVKDMTYRYEITAQDPNPGDTLVITAPFLPEWLSLTDKGNGTAILSGIPQNTDIGIHDIRLEVTDAEGTSDIQRFTIMVLNDSGSPIFSSSPVISATEDLPYTYLIQTAGPGEAAKRIITAPVLPGWLVLTDTGNGTATLSGTPGDSELGKNQVTLKVTNAAGASYRQEFEITVENINDVPVIMGQNELKMPENTTLILQVGDLKIADPDNVFPDDFALTIYDGENYTYEGNKITPIPDFEGMITVPVSVNDGEAESGRFQLMIKVSRVNKKPAAESQTITYSEDTDILIVLNGSDADEADQLAYIITALPLNGSLYQTRDRINRGLLIDMVPAVVSSENHELIYVSAPDGYGSDHGTFRFKVNDGTADSDEATVAVNIMAVNDAPVLATDRDAVLTSIMENDASPGGDSVAAIAESLIIDVDGPSSSSIAVTSADNTHGAWQYSPNGADWLPVSNTIGDFAHISAAARLLPAGYKIRFLPDRDWSGTASLTFRAWDMSGGIGTGIADTTEYGGSSPFSTDINMMTITVNALPVSGLAAVNDSPTVLGNETLLKASVEQGNNVSYTWDFGDGIAGSGISVSHVYSSLGTHVATVTAENPVSTQEASTSVTVCANSLTVTNNGNDGQGSLRWAVENICSNGIIVFDANLPEDSPITLNDPVIIYKSLTIQNSRVQNLEISGDGDTRIFEIEEDAVVAMEGLNLSQGNAEDGFGGAIYNKGDLTLIRCTLFDNSADSGIGIDDGREIKWTSKRIVESTAGEVIGLVSVAAGAVFNSGTLLMENCTVSGNTAQSDAESYDELNIRGGGAAGGFFNCGTATVRHCTFSGNSGDSGDDTGTGVGGAFQYSGRLNLQHNIIAGNVGTDAADVFGTFTSRGYNLIGDGSGSRGFGGGKGDRTGNAENPIDPVLAPLSNNSGLTLTHALNPGSPAIDAGNPKLKTNLLFDQRGEGFPRIHDGDGDGKAVIDIGAYELSFGFTSVPLTVINEGETYAYQITTITVGGSEYRITSPDILPSWLRLTDNEDGTAILEGTPDQNDVGNHAVNLQAENIYSHTTDTQSFNIRVIDINSVPRIIGQKELSIPAGNSISITLDDLTVTDWDSRYPEDFTLRLEEGDGYLRIDNLIIPTSDSAHTLRIPVIVNDGTDDSNIFYLELSVIEENRPPVITGQDNLFAAQETPLIIMLNRLKVTDPDSAYPEDFTLTVYDGENYTRNNNIITPAPDFIGMLKVPVSVNDGTDDSDIFDLTVTVTGVSENVPPVITGQNALSVTEGESLTIRRAHLTVTDPDNTYPEDFILTVYDGENYTRENNIITPIADFAGTLKVPVSVNDGTDDSDIFDLEVAVTASGENTPPVITGQKDLSAIEGTSLKIRPAYLRVTDPDNDYPEGFTFTIEDGENYTHTNNIVTPLPDFTGVLTVPVTVNDGTSESDPFMLRITVTPKEHMRSIRGTVAGLDTGSTAEINVVSPSRGISQVIELTGTGQPLQYIVTNLEPADDYRVEISSEDYLYQAYNQRDAWETADILDVSDENASGIDFKMIPGTAVISGTVEFPADASPGEIVWVNVYSPSTRAVREVSAELRNTDEFQVPYAVANLLNTGDYIVSVRSEAYKKSYYDGTENGTRNEQNALPVAGGTVNFRLERGALISGTIFGTDMSQILVEAWSESTGTGNTASPSENGDYIIEGLEFAPDFKVSAWKPDVPPFFYREDGTVRTREFAGDVSTEYENPADIDMEISEGQSIRGTVYGFSGEPVPYIWVDAWSESQQAGSGVFTGASGTYEIKGLPQAGDYKISVLPDSSMPYMPAKKTGVSSGTIGTDFMLSEKNAYTITGVIQDSEGNYIPNVEVEIRSASQDFYEWNTANRDVSEHLHLIGPYEITGIPAADDYVITARPPKNMPYTAFSESDISIHGDIIFDIILEPALKISGFVFGKDDVPIKGVRVIASSADENFRGEALTDRNGFYEITNVPDAWDYIISASADGYGVQEKLEQSPGTGMDFILEFAGGISGKITNEDGTPVPDIFVEVYSESGGNLPYYSGAAISDLNGRFVVNHLKTLFEDGTPANDYVVTAYPDGYPSFSQTQKSPGDEVLFVLPLFSYDTLSAIGISGSVRDADGNLLNDAVLDIFEKDGNFVKTADIASDGTFYACDLSAGKMYQLRFIAFFEDGQTLVQWAGEGHIGFDDPEPDSEINPADAKAYNIGERVDFRFGKHPGTLTRSQWPRQSVLSAESGIRNLRVTPSEIVSRNPNITAVWDSEDAEEKYYYLFNRESDFRITKRNAPAMRPVRARMISSETLTGDDISYYFHVASVDKRGRISDTESADFRIDTVAPSNASVTTAAKTLSSIVSLNLSANGAAEMYISNTNYGEGNKWEKWTRTKEWKLGKGDGAKKIYVQFRDRAGNTANTLGFTEKVGDMPDQYWITAVAGENGTIVPLGDVPVYLGEDVTFNILPDPGYQTDAVYVDGNPVILSHENLYTFQNVSADAAFAVTFKPKPVIFHVITAVAGENGTVTPSGEVMVSEGEEIIFTVTPNPGYEADTAILDGKKVKLRADNTFKFINVDRDYELSLSFKLKSDE